MLTKKSQAEVVHAVFYTHDGSSACAGDSFSYNFAFYSVFPVMVLENILLC